MVDIIKKTSGKYLNVMFVGRNHSRHGRVHYLGDTTDVDIEHETEGDGHVLVSESFSENS